MAVWLFYVFATSVTLAANVEKTDSTTMTSYDTIVIGMGAAGTSAASTLARAGKRVLGLEAMDRVGGRVNTVPFGDGVVELGAEWMHGTSPNPVYDLAVQNNIDTTDQDISMEVFLSDGKKQAPALLRELAGFCLRVVDEPPETPLPLGRHITNKLMDYITENHPDLLKDQDYITEFLHFMDLMINNYEGTESWNDITTESHYEELEGHQHVSWHKHGYKTLFEILLNTYKNGPGLPNVTIKLNTEVSQIVWPQDPAGKVVVITKDGGEFTADNVIVTVSVGVLKERHTTLFTPPLPPPKVAAIDHLTMGLLGKIILLFPTPWWPKEHSFFGFLWKAEDRKQVTEDTWSLRLTAGSNPAGCKNAFTIWTSGDVGRLIETLPEDVVKRKSMELIRRFMGANVTIPEPTAMVRTTWYSNPYTRGSYTFDNVDAPLHPTARADLASPLTDSSGRPRVLFAGEATDPVHFSTVHGAVDSGKREANRLLPNSNQSSCETPIKLKSRDQKRSMGAGAIAL